VSFVVREGVFWVAGIDHRLRIENDDALNFLARKSVKVENTTGFIFFKSRILGW